MMSQMQRAIDTASPTFTKNKSNLKSSLSPGQKKRAGQPNQVMFDSPVNNDDTLPAIVQDHLIVHPKNQNQLSPEYLDTNFVTNYTKDEELELASYQLSLAYQAVGSLDDQLTSAKSLIMKYKELVVKMQLELNSRDFSIHSLTREREKMRQDAD